MFTTDFVSPVVAPPPRIPFPLPPLSDDPALALFLALWRWREPWILH